MLETENPHCVLRNSKSENNGTYKKEVQVKPLSINSARIFRRSQS